MKALIKNSNYSNGTLLLDIPYKPEEIVDRLGSIGIHTMPSKLFILGKGDVTVKLIPESNFETLLTMLVNGGSTLQRINLSCTDFNKEPKKYRDEINSFLAPRKNDTGQDMVRDEQETQDVQENTETGMEL